MLSKIRTDVDTESGRLRAEVGVIQDAIAAYQETEEDRLLSRFFVGLAPPESKLPSLGLAILCHQPLAEEILNIIAHEENLARSMGELLKVCKPRDTVPTPPPAGAVLASATPPKPPVPAAKAPDDTEDADEPFPAVNGQPVGTWPKLSKRAAVHPVILFGGTRVRQKQEWVSQALKGKADWIEAPQSVLPSALLKHIAEHSITAVLIMEQLCSHGQSRALMDACRKANVPFTVAGRGGFGKVRKALDEIEQRLS
jgi:hypothetical protein